MSAQSDTRRNCNVSAAPQSKNCPSGENWRASIQLMFPSVNLHDRVHLAIRISSTTTVPFHVPYASNVSSG